MFDLEGWKILSAIVLLMLVALLALLLRLTRRPAELPYESKVQLLTAAELAFYHVLRQAIDERWEIMVQVRLADVLQVREGIESSEWRSAFNRIQSKHVDFVLCEPETLAIVAAIELDDRTHERRDRQERDAFMDAAFAAAGVPLIHIKTARAYDPDELLEVLEAL